MDYKGGRRAKLPGQLVRAPRLIVGCKRFSQSCCEVRRDTAWRKFRQSNRDYCRKEALLELDAPGSMT